MNADLFADCFTAGNVGWTVLTPPGTVVFADQKMYMGSSGANPDGIAEKAVNGLPADEWTLRYEVTEVNAPPSFNKLYFMGIFDNVGDSIVLIQLGGDGVGFIADSQNVYTFTWTPSAGATHTVISKGDAAANLTLSIDGVAVTLIPFGIGPIPGTPNVVNADISNNDADGQGSYDSIFFANGNIPDNSSFCCP